MIEDEVVREVRAAREAFAAAHGFDIRKMVAALHDLGIASGRELVQFPHRPVINRPNQPLQQTRTAIRESQDCRSHLAAPAPEL